MDTHDNGLEWMSLNENEEREELCIYQIDGTEVCLVPKRIKKKGFFLLKSIQKKPKIKTQLSVCVWGEGGRGGLCADAANRGKTRNKFNTNIIHNNIINISCKIEFFPTHISKSDDAVL
jgi:hypothetical protein